MYIANGVITLTYFFDEINNAVFGISEYLTSKTFQLDTAHLNTI